MMDCLPGRDFVWLGPHGRSVSHIATVPGWNNLKRHYSSVDNEIARLMEPDMERYHSIARKRASF
jgi:hypothetical protein